MQPTFLSFSFRSVSPRHGSRFIFILFVFGVLLFCTGFLLSIFGFQSCTSDTLSGCSMTFKVVGPALAVVGLASVLMARSRARLEVRRREMAGDQTDPDTVFLCGESRQFIQFLIFGVLFVTSGILISVLGVWIPGCGLGSPHHNVNGTVSDFKTCGFLSLQIMGPLIVLLGLCFFVVAHVKKRHNSSETDDSTTEDEPQTPTDEPFHITVGDSVIIFPPPPPPYFSDPSSQTTHHGGSTLPRSENPPSYNSIFNTRVRINGQESVRVRDTVYTISLPSTSEGYTNPSFSPEPPPKYEEKDPCPTGPTQASSPASSNEAALPPQSPPYQERE
ncbi:transmembrane protein 171 L homeolog isoform X1 [Xenopus laevis]|uniref:MGC83830 protein n=2 Tax=Xenopus laevis TaxID=8355 RepID=Q6DFB4_XENLA|nr:transmembrane protein 171 L homeolog [Xenopus laevis]XP_018101741.1 transmembrane protein 171 L homeolog isoform X1 [Xenopus laevis]XP_018101750.1 transmembrane protein 171 L homeolog isoform X1 [Xenopus laevis]AAH76826.1 MGC83830 protein [Xenopus laevis]OCU02382.1 hypothetical protein XELAEV_18008145mg [Xenopus laevis]